MQLERGFLCGLLFWLPIREEVVIGLPLGIFPQVQYAPHHFELLYPVLSQQQIDRVEYQEHRLGHQQRVCTALSRWPSAGDIHIAQVYAGLWEIRKEGEFYPLR